MLRRRVAFLEFPLFAKTAPRRRADVPREQVRPHPLGGVPAQRDSRKPGTSPLIGRRTCDRFGVYPGS